VSLLGAAVKTAKKLADEWDEAAWLKENPNATTRGMALLDVLPF
jgi:hypothetical protein